MSHMSESLDNLHPANCCLLTPGTYSKEKLCFSSHRELSQAVPAFPKSSMQCPRICRWNIQPSPWQYSSPCGRCSGASREPLGGTCRAPLPCPALTNLLVPPTPPGGFYRDFLREVQTPRASLLGWQGTAQGSSSTAQF